jgi:hypothetical protein
VAQHPIGTSPDGFPILTDTKRLPGEKPACGVCPKWDGREGTPAPLAGDDDLFGGDWFHDLRQFFHEARAVGDLAAADPFTRAAVALLDAAERRLDRQQLIDGLLAAARFISRR